jgi:hypothetical protein
MYVFIVDRGSSDSHIPIFNRQSKISLKWANAMISHRKASIHVKNNECLNNFIIKLVLL